MGVAVLLMPDRTLLGPTPALRAKLAHGSECVFHVYSDRLICGGAGSTGFNGKFDKWP